MGSAISVILLVQWWSNSMQEVRETCLFGLNQLFIRTCVTSFFKWYGL